jgi:hypothetical protein
LEAAAVLRVCQLGFLWEKIHLAGSFLPSTFPKVDANFRIAISLNSYEMEEEKEENGERRKMQNSFSCKVRFM